MTCFMNIRFMKNERKDNPVTYSLSIQISVRLPFQTHTVKK